LGSGRIILVSDAMPGKSMEDGEFIFSNLLSVKKDGKAWVKETGRLAGSVMPLNEALRNMAKICGAGDAELAEMASANPAKLLGLYGEYGSIAPGKKADLAIFDNDYKTVMTFIDGKIVFRA
jgi:N-acetylglucosamine-6-phosphate deacetylase